MSVLEKKRSLSDMEFYKNALRLNQAVAEWLMRDFGTRRNPRSVNQVIKDISESDQKIIDNIFSKYGCSSKHEFVSELYQLTGQKVPYDMERLNSDRQKVRDRINEIEAELNTLENR